MVSPSVDRSLVRRERVKLPNESRGRNVSRIPSVLCLLCTVSVPFRRVKDRLIPLDEPRHLLCSLLANDSCLSNFAGPCLPDFAEQLKFLQASELDTRDRSVETGDKNRASCWSELFSIAWIMHGFCYEACLRILEFGFGMLELELEIFLN